MVRAGRYVAAPEKRSRPSFLANVQERQPFSLNIKTSSAWWSNDKAADLNLSYSYYCGMSSNNLKERLTIHTEAWAKSVWTKFSDPYALSNLSVASGFIDVVRHYGGKLKQAETIADKYELERTLAEVSDNRDVVAALMEREGLGLQLLANLRAYSKMRLSEFVSKTGMDPDDVASVVARLVRGRVVIVDDLSFVCTDRGLDILKNLELNSGVTITPEA